MMNADCPEKQVLDQIDAAEREIDLLYGSRESGGADAHAAVTELIHDVENRLRGLKYLLRLLVLRGPFLNKAS